MSQITARVSDELVLELDKAATQLQRSRAEIVRLALEHYLDDFQDLSLAAQRLRDPSDPILDWDEVRDAVVGKD
jgi:transposase